MTKWWRAETKENKTLYIEIEACKLSGHPMQSSLVVKASSYDILFIKFRKLNLNDC